MLYDTSDDHETPIIRPRDLQDNATPSGNAMAVTTLLKLAGFANEPRYAELAYETLAQMQSMMAQYPLGFGQWLQALSYALSPRKEIAIVGEPDADDRRSLLAVAQDGYTAHYSPPTDSLPLLEFAITLTGSSSPLTLPCVVRWWQRGEQPPRECISLIDGISIANQSRAISSKIVSRSSRHCAAQAALCAVWGSL